MTDQLTPVAELAAKSNAHWPNESRDYRKARTALLTKEIALRRRETTGPTPLREFAEARTTDKTTSRRNWGPKNQSGRKTVDRVSMATRL